MLVEIAKDREGARAIWRECQGELPLAAVKLAMEIFPGSEVVSFMLADEEHQIPAKERFERARPESARKEWWR